MMSGLDILLALICDAIWDPAKNEDPGAQAQRVQTGEAFHAQAGKWVGRTCVVSAAVRPRGFVMIDGRRVDAASESGLIETGRQVRIVSVGQDCLIVRRSD
jgi:membrane-bound ClpP family serine protease